MSLSQTIMNSKCMRQNSAYVDPILGFVCA